MSDSDDLDRLPPAGLFVIACPVCRATLAAGGSLRGRDACCPLCAGVFRVPGRPGPADADPSPGRPGLAEDWEGVIGQLEPPSRRHPMNPGHDAPPKQPSSRAALLEPVLPGQLPPIGATAPPPAAAGGMPRPAGQPVEQSLDLSLTDPVRTIRQGDTIREIRRLSRGERRTRRVRRTLILILAGIGILLAIVSLVWDVRSP